MKRVSYIFPISHHFRYPFHVMLRDILAADGIDYRVVYSAPFGANLRKKDTVDISWGHRVPLIKVGSALLQWAPADLMQSDLVIVQQENRLLLNYFAQSLGMIGIGKVAYFGHGRNFQAASHRLPTEQWKRFWATKVHWWFAYTEETKKHLLTLGYPSNRVTVFNNAVDTSELRTLRDSVTETDLQNLRSALGLVGRNVGIYVGGLYSEKRLPFLIDSIDIVRDRVADFEFIVIGGGPEQDLIEVAATTRPWIRFLGPKFGREKVQLMALAHLFLIPGLVGLAVLDAGIMGLPVVTTSYPFHSPEIAYLKDGVNGVIVRPWDDATAYADSIIALMTSQVDRRAAMSVAARATAFDYSIEAMAARFAEGVRSSLSM